MDRAYMDTYSAASMDTYSAASMDTYSAASIALSRSDVSLFSFSTQQSFIFFTWSSNKLMEDDLLCHLALRFLQKSR